MKQKAFHFRPYHFKKYNPQDHSCAVCKNQPIWFSRVPDHQRDVKLPARQWKPGVRDRDIWEAEVDDVFDATTAHTDALKMPSKCPRGSWSRAAPFYSNDCTSFEGAGSA